MKRLLVLPLLALSGACEREPRCDTFSETQDDLECEPVEICCQGKDCWYETNNGDRFDCTEDGDCGIAAIQVACAVCDIGELTADEVGC